MPPPGWDTQRKAAAAMGLADRLNESPNKVSITAACQTCQFLSTLEERDRLAVNVWASTAGANMAELHRECKVDGLRVEYRNFIAHFEKGHHLEPR